MSSGKVIRVAREVTLCAAPAAAGGFDPATEHTVLGGLVAIFVGAAFWMFRRWPSRSTPAAAGTTSERAPSSPEPAAEALAPRPRPAATRRRRRCRLPLPT